MSFQGWHSSVAAASGRNPCPGQKPPRIDLSDPPTRDRRYGFASASKTTIEIATHGLRRAKESDGSHANALRCWVMGMRERGPGDRPRSGCPLVEVMEPTDLRDGHHAPELGRLHLAWLGTVVVE